jgi:hypothetical protein
MNQATMPLDIHIEAVSNKMLWTGRIISTLVTLFMLMDGVMKLFKPAPVVQGTLALGYPESSIVGIGVALLVCTVLYAIPRTAVLGAICVTGYLGGAIASQVRLQAPLFNIVFPFLFCVLVWLGLVLRDGQLRRLIPLRS